MPYTRSQLLRLALMREYDAKTSEFRDSQSFEVYYMAEVDKFIKEVDERSGPPLPELQPA